MGGVSSQEGGSAGGVGTTDVICLVLIDSYKSGMLSELPHNDSQITEKCSY